MHRALCTCSVAGLLLISACCSEENATFEPIVGFTSSDGLVAGVSVVDISPSPDDIATERVTLGGYGSLFENFTAEGVHDPIYARTLFVGGTGGALVVAALDVPGIGNRTIRAIQQNVARRIELAAEQVFVAATHTHGGPDLQGFWGYVPDAYEDRVVALTADAIVEAFDMRQPATLRVSTGSSPSENRRGGDETDTAVTVLDVVHAVDDTRIATLINYAAHPTYVPAGNTLVTRDFPGYLVDYAEKQLDAPVIFVNGACGDVVGADVDEVGFSGAQAAGELIARAALDSMMDAEDVSGDAVVVGAMCWRQPISNFMLWAAAAANLLNYDVERRGGCLAVTTRIGYFRLGDDVEGITFPGEAMTRLGLDLKDTLVTDHRLFLGLTGDSLGYFIPQDEWMNPQSDDGYDEEIFSLALEIGEAARDAFQDLLARLASVPL